MLGLGNRSVRKEPGHTKLERPHTLRQRQTHPAGVTIPCAGFRFSGLEFRISDYEFRVSDFGFRISSVGCRISSFGFGYRGVRAGEELGEVALHFCRGCLCHPHRDTHLLRVSGFGFRVLVLRFLVSGIWYLVSGSGSHVFGLIFSQHM